jgi:hypothetical protein
MIWQRDCESFSNFQCCVLEIALEPQSFGHLKILTILFYEIKFNTASLFFKLYILKLLTC